MLLSDRCRNIQINRLRADKEHSVISFSMDTDAANVLRLGTLGNAPFAQISGFVSTGQQTYKTVVEDWLRHEDIANLELTAISDRYNDATIKKFLACLGP